MKVLVPLAISNAMVLSTNMVEAPPATYAAGTMYAVNALVAVGAVGDQLTVYKSLQAGNVGHTPGSNPTWWQEICKTYAEYNAGTTYALGARVLDVATHQIYESQVAGNVGQPLTTGTKWLPIGTSNRQAPFDRLRNTQAVAPVDIVYTIATGVRTPAIALIGIDATSVSIVVKSGGAQVYAVTVPLGLRVSRGWRDYYYGPFRFRKSVVFFNLPLYRDAEITVTISKTTGQRGIGGILLGSAVYLGEVQKGANSDELNFSVVERNAFGDITLEPRRSVPKLRKEIFFDKSLASTVFSVREQLNGTPAFFVGLEDFTNDYFELLARYGIHKEFSINCEDFDYGVISLEVEEL